MFQHIDHAHLDSLRSDQFLHFTLHPQPKNPRLKPTNPSYSPTWWFPEFLPSHLSNFTKPTNMGAHFQQGRHPNFCPAHSCNNKLTWTSAVNVTQTMQCHQDSNVFYKWPQATSWTQLYKKYSKVRYSAIQPLFADFVFSMIQQALLPPPHIWSDQMNNTPSD